MDINLKNTIQSAKAGNVKSLEELNAHSPNYADILAKEGFIEIFKKEMMKNKEMFIVGLIWKRFCYIV